MAARRWRGLFGAVVLVVSLASVATVAGADVSTRQGTLCSADPTTVAPGEPVILDASSLDANFVEFDKQGNGEFNTTDETDFIENVSYNQTGEYDARVRADGDNSRVSNCGRVTVQESPNAALSVSPRPGTAGQPTTLDASESADPDGSIVEYRWDFNGNGTTDAETADATTTTTYSQADSYGPRVTVVDDDGATASAGADYLVQEPPNAALSVSPRPGTAGQSTSFDASESADPDGSIVEYRWDFLGNRTPERTTSSPTTSYTYSQAGSYVPRVTVVDDDNATASAAADYTVEAANDPPEAALSVSPRPGTAGQPTTLDASESADPDGSIVEYAWDFDGDSVFDDRTTTATTTHTYQQGPYSPGVTVIDDDDAAASETTDYLVEPAQGPRARCVATPDSVGVDEVVTVDATDSENAELVSYDPDGDGEYERTDRSTFTLEWTYAKAGTYAPQVRVRTGNQTDTTDCGEVTVEAQNRPPEAALSVSPRPGTAGQSTSFDASESADPDGSVVEYRWDFLGNRTPEQTTNSPTTSYTYSQAGSYVPRVTVVDDDNATASAAADYSVEEPPPEPRARCTVTPRTVTPGEAVTIDARESANAFTAEFDADGDGSFEREREGFSLTTSYDDPGTYTPRVRVQGELGTDTTDCGEVVVEAANDPPEAALSVSPRPGTAGQPTTLDASESADPDGTVVEYRWDTDGDGTVDDRTTTATTTTTYRRGSYSPRVTVVDDDNSTASAGADYLVQEPVQARCTVTPRTVTPGEVVTIDARESANAFTAEFDADGDGSFERERDALVLETRYDDPGTYTPRVRVTGEAGTDTTECGEVVVEANDPPAAALSVSPRPGLANESVTLDASNSTDPDGTIVEYRWDTDGDGTVDDRTTTATTTANLSAGEYDPAVTVVDDDNATAAATDEYTVEQPAGPSEESGDSGQSIPWLPVGLGVAGLAGVGGLGYYLLGSGGGGGGGGGAGTTTPKPKPKPKPTADNDRPAAYETGVFALPSTSGSFSVSVGFEPDVLELRSANGARTDTVVDRTEGWSQGIVVAGETTTQHAMTVADDAHAGDRAVCAASESAALELIRHEDDAPPGRVTVRVTDTTTDGFEVDVSVPGDDPLVSGTRVLFTAIRTGSDAEARLGSFETPTEPGTQAVDLPVAAEYVSLLGSAAVEDRSALWTTDRSTALSYGHAVAGDSIRQVVAGVSAWPGPGHTTGAVCSETAALALLYQNGERVAGETTASATGVGGELRLQYDRVYSGPHKLGSTARHPVSYLALSGAEIRPAVGQFRFPGPDQTTTVDCGFQPAMVEVTVVPAGPGERPTETESYPFGWSQGTAIARDGHLSQYVVHHAVAAESVPTVEDTDPTVQSGAPETVAASDGGVADGLPADISPTGLGSEPVATEPTAHDDGRAGLWLWRGPDGAVAGRDELRVTALTDTGFEATVRSLAAANRENGERPTVVYRAWPAVSADDTRTEAPREEWQALGQVTDLDDRTTPDQTDRRQENTR